MEYKQLDYRTGCKQISRLYKLIWKSKQRNSTILTQSWSPFLLIVFAAVEHTVFLCNEGWLATFQVCSLCLRHAWPSDSLLEYSVITSDRNTGHNYEDPSHNRWKYPLICMLYKEEYVVTCRGVFYLCVWLRCEVRMRGEGAQKDHVQRVYNYDQLCIW